MFARLLKQNKIVGLSIGSITLIILGVIRHKLVAISLGGNGASDFFLVTSVIQVFMPITLLGYRTIGLTIDKNQFSYRRSVKATLRFATLLVLILIFLLKVWNSSLFGIASLTWDLFTALIAAIIFETSSGMYLTELLANGDGKKYMLVIINAAITSLFVYASVTLIWSVSSSIVISLLTITTPFVISIQRDTKLYRFNTNLLKEFGFNILYFKDAGFLVTGSILAGGLMGYLRGYLVSQNQHHLGIFVVFITLSQSYWNSILGIASNYFIPRDNQTENDDILNRLIIFQLLLVAVMYVFLYYIKDLVLLFYSKDFLDVGLILRYGKLGIIIRLFSFVLVIVLTRFKHFKTVALNEYIASITLLVAGLTFYTLKGLIGIGIGFSIAQLISFLFLFFSSYMATEINKYFLVKSLGICIVGLLGIFVLI